MAHVATRSAAANTVNGPSSCAQPRTVTSAKTLADVQKEEALLWTLKDLIEHSMIVMTEINGNWVPVRPERPWGLWGLKIRLHAAWAVLMGRAEAFTWPEGQ